MKKFVVKSLLTLVGASIFVLANLSSRVALSQTSTSSEENSSTISPTSAEQSAQTDESLSDEPILFQNEEATPFTLNGGGTNTTNSIPRDPDGSSSPSTSTTISISPDIKVTQHIRSIDYSDCVSQLFKIIPSIRGFDLLFGAESSAAACLALTLSDNKEPPNSFNSSSWQTFKNSKEYRSYIHIPSIIVSCKAGKIVNYTKPSNEYSYGYTKNPPFGFSDGDVYTPPYNTYSFGTSAQKDYLVVRDRRASRLANSERLLQYPITTYDSPFIYTDVEADIYCNGTIKVNVNRPIFPTTRLYINDEFNSEVPQTNLGDFIKSGGKNFNPNGQGNLAPAGKGLNWSGRG